VRTEGNSFAALEKLKARAAAYRDGLKANKTTIMVGTATCGRAAGALEVVKAFHDEIKQQGLDCPVIETGCLGHCYAEPLVIITKPGLTPVVYAYVNPVIAERLVREYIMGDNPCPENVLAALEPNPMLPSFEEFPRARVEKKIITRNCGLIDPTSIEDYINAGGYAALAKALQSEPQDIIDEIVRSGLRGRGGAGYPAGEKLQACRWAINHPKYLVCNADEGDPGSFADRSLIESDPHSIIEGMLIAAYAAGADKGYIYIRVEYPLAVARLQTALSAAKEAGLTGQNIMGTDFNFDIVLFPGAGAFVCGEETALIASLEGYPGLPRVRPPYPAEKGLFGKPTLVNNVKTLAYMPHIIHHGSAWFSATGTRTSPGTAVFSLAGKVVNTGTIEVPMGTSLRKIIEDGGSGVPNKKKLKAVQIGGPSGGCLPEQALDLPVDFESLQKAGAIMGSGGIIVLDEDDCMVEMARYFMEFCRRESCGKCTFCRLGTRQMLEILNDIVRGAGSMDDLKLLEKLAAEVKAGSLCALGQTAPNPVLTTLRYFKNEYTEHIALGRCPALMCRHLTAYYIMPDKCERSCDACVGSCTVEAITPARNRIKVIDQVKCVKCGTCLKACPPQYSAIVRLSPSSLVPVSERSKKKDQDG
jgi:NADH-quinone oxidoreductase subunit F